MKDSRRPKAAKRDIAELWLPLWQRPLSIAELSALLAEGRANIGRRVADNGLDFARAAAGLGVDRGITAFQRTAFLMRNGQSFMSIPLGRFAVRGKRNVGLLREPAFERWLGSFRRACGEKAPPRFASALRQIDRAIFDFCRYGRDGSEHSSGDPFLQAVLIALGRAEAAIASAPGFRTHRQTGRASILPLAGLSADWIAAADDGSAEYEIALALAGIGGGEGGRSIRRNLEPFTIEKRRAAWAEKERAVVWNAADLSTNLAAVLARRLMDGARREDDAVPGVEPVHPLESVDAASLETVAAFLTPGALDEERIADLLWGLVLIDTSRETYRLRGYALGEDATALLIALALLKIRRFLASGLRLRTACDLELAGETALKVTRPENFNLPDEETLLAECHRLVGVCAEASAFAQPAITEVTWAKDAKKRKVEITELPEDAPEPKLDKETKKLFDWKKGKGGKPAVLEIKGGDKTDEEIAATLFPEHEAARQAVLDALAPANGDPDDDANADGQ